MDERKEKLVRILRELDNVDPEGIPIYTYEEWEKRGNRKDFAALIVGFLMGAIAGAVILAMLSDHIK